MPSAPHAHPDPETGLSKAEDPIILLVFQIGREDRSAFDTLFDLWAPVLLGIAARMLGNHQEAEEAVKESFVRIWHRAAEYDCSHASPFVWGFTILRAVCIDRLKHQNRQKQGLIRNAAATLLSPAPSTSESTFLPTEPFRLARRAVDYLPLDERRCLELAVFLEYAQTETPNALDTRSDSDLDRVQDALASLRTITQDSP